MSAFDNVLWDRKGKYFSVPIYQLLGGGARSKVKAYVSCLYISMKPGAMQQKAKAVKAEGYTDQKWFLKGNPEKLDASGLEVHVETVGLLKKVFPSDPQLVCTYRRVTFSYLIPRDEICAL